MKNSPLPSRPSRILIVIRQFHPFAAGAETQALRQAKSYMAAGHKVRVVTAGLDKTLPKYDTVDGVEVRRLRSTRLRFIGSLVYLASLALYVLLNRKWIDSILTFHLKQSSALVTVLGRLLSKRVVISVQAAGQLGDVQYLRLTVGGGLIFWCCRHASAFIGGSSDIVEELVAAGLPRRSIYFIPNGIPVDEFRPKVSKGEARSRLALPADAFVVLNIGRHTAQKGLKTVIAAWREFAPAKSGALLVLVGDGDERPELERMVREAGIETAVRFEGWRTNVMDYLAAADVFATASLFEGTHIALGEAMAAGLPVVATAVGGARDFVADGENGIVFPVGDAHSQAKALTRLARDRTLRETMGRAAAARAREFLDQDVTALKHLMVLLSPPERKSAPPKIRVTHLIATLDRGGSEGQMVQLAARLNPQRFDCDVLCLTRGGPAGEVLDKAGIPYRVIGKRVKHDLFPLVWLARHLFKSPPSILHTWLFTSNAYGRAAAILAGVSRVVSAERSTDPWKTPFHRAIDSLLSAKSARIVANSASVAASIVEHGIPSTKVTMIQNGVDTSRFAPMDARDARFVLGLQVQSPCFGYIGRLAFEKRPEVFVRVARSVVAQLPHAHAIVFGEGPMEEELKRQTWRFRQHLTFFGDCPFPELCHSAVDCLVLTSQWEGFPNVILEAMSCGRPVVAVRMPATEEMVDDGITGILTDDDPDAMADAVVYILSNPIMAASMGAAARRRVEAQYSMEKMVKAYEELYIGLLGGPRGTAL